MVEQRNTKRKRSSVFMSNFKRNDINCKFLLTKDSLVEDTIKVYAEEFYSLRGM